MVTAVATLDRIEEDRWEEAGASSVLTNVLQHSDHSWLEDMHPAQASSRSFSERWRRWRQQGTGPGNFFASARSTSDCECGCPESEPLLKRMRRQLSGTFSRHLSDSGPVRSAEEELNAIRSRLRFHFTDFHKKYKEHKKKPWKFVLQILKVILISVLVSARVKYMCTTQQLLLEDSSCLCTPHMLVPCHAPATFGGDSAKFSAQKIAGPHNLGGI